MSRIDPIKEARAAAALRQSIASLDEDDALLIDMVEGETSLFEAVDAILERMAQDRVLVAGTEAVIAELDQRKGRFAKRIESDRALIEQALMIAEIDTAIERPTATITLAKRPAKLVIETESDIPAEFWKTAAPTLDKKALAAAIKDGATIPGAVMSNAAPSLTIRTR